MSLLQIIKFNIFEHNHTLPETFNNLKEKLLSLSKEGLICEDVVEKYI